MSEVPGILVSIFSGGLTGFLSAALQRFADYKNKQLDMEMADKRFEHERLMRAQDEAIMEKEWSGRVQVAEVESAARVETADAQAFAASFSMEPQLYSSKVKPTRFAGNMLVILDFIRGLVRPLLTIYLVVLTTMLYFHARRMMGAMNYTTAEQSLELMRLIIQTILYLTTTCALHYFGTRNKQKAPRL